MSQRLPAIAPEASSAAARAAPSDASAAAAAPARKVVVLSSKEWPGLFMTASLARAGVDIAAMVVAREPLDDVTANPRRWRQAQRAVGVRQATSAFLGSRFGLRHALRRLSDREGYPVLGDIRRLGVPVHTVDDFKSRECHRLVAELRPDVIVICGTPILPESLLSIARECAVNIHTSLLPHYRGGGSLFWPLFFRDYDKVGYTIHKAVAAVDAGPYLHQEAVPVDPGDSPEVLLRRCFTAAVPRLARLLRDDPLTGDSWKNYASPAAASLRRPTPAVHSKLNGPTLLQAVKRQVRQASHVTGLYPIRRRGTAGRVVVCTWHRTLSDDISGRDWRRVLGHPTVSELREKLSYLKRRCRIVGVTQALRMLQENAGAGLDENYAVLTVDDGFTDFRTHLLPLLEQLSVPASLFVCTGAVAAGSVWYQDVYNLIDRVKGERLFVPWMDTRVFFGDVTHRVVTVEHVLLPYLKRLRPESQHRQIETLYTSNALDRTPSAADAFCTVEDLRALASSPLVELHLHSNAHQPLGNLTGDEVRQDLDRCREFFRQRIGRESTVLSYPNGSFKEWQWPFLAEAGVTHAFTTRPGAVRADAFEPFALPRIGIGSEDVADFSWRMTTLTRGG
jgi:peptidoglycan/xylan/chitin deacetylase (PgdA/CDA1 family)